MAKCALRRVEHWRPIIADWRRSGLSVTAFCRSRNLNKAGFHYWRNILDELDRPSTTQHQPRPSRSPHRPSCHSA